MGQFSGIEGAEEETELTAKTGGWRGTEVGGAGVMWAGGQKSFGLLLWTPTLDFTKSSLNGSGDKG